MTPERELIQIYEAILNLNSHRLIPVDSEKLARISELKAQINAPQSYKEAISPDYHPSDSRHELKGNNDNPQAFTTENGEITGTISGQNIPTNESDAIWINNEQ